MKEEPSEINDDDYEYRSIHYEDDYILETLVTNLKDKLLTEYQNTAVYGD